MNQIEINITGYDREDNSRVEYYLDKDSFRNPLSTLERLAGNPSDFFADRGNYKMILTKSQNIKFMEYLKKREYHLYDFGNIEGVSHILAFSFGMNPDVNAQLASIVQESMAGAKNIEVTVQWEIANVIHERTPGISKLIHRIDLDYDKDYITTDQVIRKFTDDVLAGRSDIKKPSLLLVAQSWHAPRCIQSCKNSGLDVTAGRFSELFSCSDPQRWVRNAFSWVLKEGTKK